VAYITAYTTVQAVTEHEHCAIVMGVGVPYYGALEIVSLLLSSSLLLNNIIQEHNTVTVQCIMGQTWRQQRNTVV